MLLVFAMVAVLLACVSPTLPLPPPTAPDVTAGPEPDTYRLTSQNGAQAQALIVVVNQNTSYPPEKRVTGTIADERGSWQLVVYAKPNDWLDISQESGSTRSGSTTIHVR
jgi:hypothetical protein